MVKLMGGTKHSDKFEPSNPILNKRDFTDELMNYCDKNHKELFILHEGMEPVVEIDGEKYVCMLETPRMLEFPFSIFFASAHSFGFKWVYIYKYEMVEAGA